MVLVFRIEPWLTMRCEFSEERVIRESVNHVMFGNSPWKGIRASRKLTWGFIYSSFVPLFPTVGSAIKAMLLTV